MAFRKNSEDRMIWKRFVAKYKERLVEVGIPDVVFRSDRAWSYFIDHEYDYEYPELLNLDDWGVDDLKRLLPIFQEMSQNGEYVGIVLMGLENINS